MSPLGHRDTALVDLVIRERKAPGLTQVQVAKKLRRYQSYVTLLETGQRRLDIIEFMDIADAIGSTRRPRSGDQTPSWWREQSARHDGRRRQSSCQALEIELSLRLFRREHQRLIITTRGGLTYGARRVRPTRR